MDTVLSTNSTHKGYVAKRRTRTFTCTDIPELQPEEGYDPIWVEVVTALTWGEREAIRRHDKQRYDERFPLIAPYVVAWNVMATNTDGEVVPVPPPAEGGPDVFRLIDPLLFDWIDLRVMFGHTSLLDPKPSTTSGATPESEQPEN